MYKPILYMLLASLLSSCLTGGFDENPQLTEREEALAKAPRVESIAVNGKLIERNTVSRRVVEAKPGAELQFSVNLASGDGATLKALEFSRVYYFGDEDEEDPHPVDPSHDVYELSGHTHVFTYTYTVPIEDDDGHAFEPGQKIQVYFRITNTLDNAGFKSLEIHLI